VLTNEPGRGVRIGMKYDDAEYVMSRLEEAYPESTVTVKSFATSDDGGETYRGERTYNVKCDFPQGLDPTNSHTLIDLQSEKPNVEGIILSQYGKLVVLFKTRVGNRSA
jgi:hypothetical protein